MTFNDKYILYFVWIATGISIPLFIPKNKRRLAWVSFLFSQVLTWPLGLFVADMHWIQYPVRMFAEGTHGSFTYEYFFYPIMCSFFNAYFPTGERRLWMRATYYAGYCSILTLAELFLLHNTNLIRYIHWNAFFTWISLFTTFSLTRKFCLWFFKPGSDHHQ